MPRTLIAGCGYVGRELARRLLADGDEVWALRRRPAAPPRDALDALPDAVHPIAADLTASPDALALPDALDRVVYALAADAFTESAYRAAYVDGLRNLLAALARQSSPPRRLVYVSSTGVHAQTAGEWIDETSPTEPTGFSGRTLIEAERNALAGQIPATVLRLGGICGPGRASIIDSVLNGEATLDPAADRWTNRIHRDDAAGAIRHLLRLDRPDAVYFGVDNEPALRNDILCWLADRLGRPHPPFAPAAASAPRRGGNKRCRNARLLAAGYAFRYPTYREGYGALIENAQR
jgi:nucleoside-diphosphate-sugar epimerase